MDIKAFKGKTAIVTGAGQGIGFEIARQLCGQGAAVILNDIDGLLAEEAARRIVEEGGLCKAVPGDSSEMVTIERMVGMAASEFGRLDIVVANAGITLFGEFLT